MAINIYLNEKTPSHKINVNVNASLTQIAGDLDGGTLPLEWNKVKYPIAPQNKIIIEDTTNDETWEFVVIKDSVSIVKKIPEVVYLHNIAVSQNTNSLKFHIVRNSSFSQPVETQKVVNYKLPFYLESTHIRDTHTFIPNIKFPRIRKVGATEYNRNSITIKTNKHTKFFNPFIDVDIITQSYQNYQPTTASNKYNYYNGGIINRNDYTNDVEIVFTNNDDLTDTMTITLPNGTNRHYFSQDEIEWMKNRSFYMTLNDNLTFREPIDFPSYTAPNYTIYRQFVLGYAWITLHLQNYYYSLYDVLETLLKQQQKFYNNDYDDLLFTMPLRDSEDGLELDSIIAPEFSFTGKDIYSCIVEVLSYIDAFPILKDNVLSFEYLNNLSNVEIENLKVVDRQSMLTEEYHTNKLIANYQNGKQYEPIIYPAKNIYKRIGSKSYGIPTRDDYEFKLPFKIDYIDKVKIELENYEYILHIANPDEVVEGYWAYQLDDKVINFFETNDITDCIYEKSEYSLLNYDRNYPSQLTTLYYDKGGDTIYMGAVTDTNGDKIVEDVYIKAVLNGLNRGMGLYGNYDTLTDIAYIDFEFTTQKRDIRLNVTYHALYDGRVSQESTENKYNGETYVNQSNSGVQLNRMGNNMQGLIARLGNESKFVSIPVTSYGSRLKVGSLWVDDDGNKWFVNQVKTTFSTKTDNVIVEAQFTKDYNMLSLFSKIDQEKRFYEISDTLTTKGYENINEFIYVSYLAHNELATAISLNQDTVKNIFDYTFNRHDETIDNKKIDMALITTYENVIDTVSSKRDIYVPMHTYGFGNSLCFEIGFDNSVNAGDRLVGNATVGNPLLNMTTLYTADNGFADKVDIEFLSFLKNDYTYAGESFPDMSDFFDSITVDDYFSCMKINSLRYYKKPNEIFHLNYSVCFLPYSSYITDDLGIKHYKAEEIYFGDKFINENGIFRNTNSNNYDGGKFYLYVSTSQKFSIIDNKVLESCVLVDEVDIETIIYSQPSTNATYGKLTIKPKTDLTFNGISWCIADSFGNVYLSGNRDFNNNDKLELYLFTRRKRI